MRLLLILSLFFYSSLALLRTYSNNAQLSPMYSVSWNIEGDTIQLALMVNTTGWVGFGIGEPTSGSMPGADILTATVSDDGTVSIQDRYTLEKAMPLEDDCPHWKLISGWQTADQTIVEVERKLDTGDQQDRPIVPGLTRILYAFGNTDVFQYHGTTNRHLGAIELIPTNQTFNNTYGDSLEFTVNFTIPTQTTFYLCQSFYIPINTDKHIIRIEPIINPATAAYVHHFVVQRCAGPTNFTQDRLNRPGDCDSDPCLEYIWEWAPGMGALELPAEAGFRVGPSDGAIKLVVLQIHYNNPNGDAGMVDTSGFRVRYTANLRKYDAAVLQLGDPLVSAKDISPGISSNPYEFNCPIECTSNWPHDLIVFADVLHMHQIGKQMYTTHWRNDTLLQVLNRVDFYQFALQQTTIINTVIKPGDRLNTHCIYDSTPRTSITQFNLGSTDEMCIDFVYYYPALSGSLCGYHRIDEGNVTICTALPLDSPFLPIANPTIPDPYVLPITFGNKYTGACAPLVQTMKPTVATYTETTADSQDINPASIMYYSVGLALWALIALL